MCARVCTCVRCVPDSISPHAAGSRKVSTTRLSLGGRTAWMETDCFFSPLLRSCLLPGAEAAAEGTGVRGRPGSILPVPNPCSQLIKAPPAPEDLAFCGQSPVPGPCRLSAPPPNRAGGHTLPASDENRNPPPSALSHAGRPLTHTAPFWSQTLRKGLQGLSLGQDPDPVPLRQRMSWGGRLSQTQGLEAAPPQWCLQMQRGL